MTPTKIFKKTREAYEVAMVALFVFWLPILSLIVLYYINT
jgi:hypothetical protein